MNAHEDLADVERVLAGDTAAFEGIVRRWQGPLVNLAYRFCHDRGRAEDMAQEAFLRAYRGLPTWRKDAAFSTWLFAVATNLYRSEIRRIPSREQPFDPAVPPASGDASTDRAIEARQTRRLVRRAVQHLPARYREALVLFYFHQQDVAAVAGSLKVPVGTVKARLSRGRDMLRKKLETLLRGDGAGQEP